MTEILIVEDESIVAQDILNRLTQLGYTVSAVVSSGEEAVEKAKKMYPDLVLMDIVLKGGTDGIEAAETIRARLNIPVVYVTAYADKKTLQRAKITEPYGYLLKPFEDRELHTAIEMALYKHEMEKKVRESQQWLATTLKSIGDGVIATDTEGLVTFMNPVAEVLTGWTQKEAAGKPLKDVFRVINGETGAPTENSVTHILKKDAVSRLTSHAILRVRDGTTLPIHESAAPIKDDKGVATGVVFVFQDVTERRRMEQNLRDSEEKYKHIAENSIDGVGMAQNGKIIYVNDAYCRIFGYKREELIGESLLKVVAPEDLPLIRERAKRRLEGENVPDSYVFKGMRKDGTELFIGVSTSQPFIYRGTPTILAILRDVTKRKKAEMQLKNLFEASRLINSTMDIDETYSFISEAVQKLVGFDNFIVFLVSKDKKSIYPVYGSGKIKKRVKDLNYGEGLVGSCVAAKETVLVEDAPHERGIDTPDMRSHIIVPLIIEDDCVGALHISKGIPHGYDQQDVDMVNLLSEVGSSALRNALLHSEIKEFGKELERRIKERSERIEILLSTRQELQKEQSWEKGLITIVDSMEKLGFERVGIFLVDPIRKTLDSHFVKGANIPKGKISVPLKDTEYFGVKCVLEKKTTHVREYNLEEGKQVVGDSQSFVWVPIVVQNEAFAALAADNVESSKVITEEDVKDMEILAGMCAAFIDRTRIQIEPVAEKRLKTKFKHWLEPLEVYIVTEKKPKKSFEIFVDLVTHGIPGFAVSRVYPEKLKRKYNLVKTPVLWLSRTEGENTISPDDLSKLRYIIEDFTRKSEESVILMDGLEYLITQTGFEPMLKYLQELKDTVALKNTRLIIPVHKETMSPREFGILEREFVVLESD